MNIMSTTFEENTLEARLRSAREQAGLSRAQLSEQTGVPAKSIEKYENGTQDITLPRVHKIAEALGVSVNWIMGDASEDQNMALTAPAELGEPKEHYAEDVAPLAHVTAMLKHVDEMREVHFDGMRRRLLGVMDDIRAELKYLEPGELLELAKARGLNMDYCKLEDEIDDLFAEDQNAAQTYCQEIEERILDTAVLGFDLFAMDRDELANMADDVAEKFEIEKPGFLGLSWGEIEDFIPLIREPLRSNTLQGNVFRGVESHCPDKPK